MKRERSLTIKEFMIVFCVICIFGGIFAGYINTRLRIAKEAVLRNELVNLRKAIEYFRILYGRLPEDLEELKKKDLTYKTENDKIKCNNLLSSFRYNKSGFLADSFGNRYGYDVSGRVWSKTEGYESW